MNAKKLLALLLALCLVLTFAVGCGGSSESAADGGDQEASGDPEQTIMVAYFMAVDHPVDKSMNLFKEYVEENSDSLKIELYPNSQLGSEDVYIDSCVQGTVQMGISGTMCAKYHPAIYAQETPYLFSTWEEAKTYLNGDYGNMLYDGFEADSGLVYLGSIVNGFREFSCNFEIKDMDSFKGIRMRVPNVPNYVEMVEALGGSPIAMSLTDLFTALEQKSVDGQDNPYPTDLLQSFYEVQGYALESHHMFSPQNIFMNADFYNNTLTDAQREVIQAGLKEAIDHNWSISEDYDGEAKQQLIDNGMQITEPSEEFLGQMQAAMEPVYEWYYSEIAGSEEYIKAVLQAEGRA